MAKHGQVVIGALFGDEGKGLVTDALAAQTGRDAIVVRFNGGAQAGHTVVAPDGRRHVFSHFGSGSFAGAPTFLSRFFLANPLLFLKEAAALRALGVRPRVLIDPAAVVTTPYDMMLNQAAEAARGAGRHGSCGAGIGETVERSLDPALRIEVRDLDCPRQLAKKLDAIRLGYARQRMLGLGIPAAALEGMLGDDAIADRFLEDTASFLAQVELAGVAALRDAGSVIFEGAQGLLLDEERGFFPHVTRSHTGIRNALVLAAEAGLDALEVFYVTRCYATRHGAGPLPHEVTALPYPGISDPTNQPNAHQGALRFGWLDLDLLARTVRQDLSDQVLKPRIRLVPGMVVTCLDQVGGRVGAVEGGQLRLLPERALLDRIEAITGLECRLAARGPTRDDLRSRSLGKRSLPDRSRLVGHAAPCPTYNPS